LVESHLNVPVLRSRVKIPSGSATKLPPGKPTNPPVIVPVGPIVPTGNPHEKPTAARGSALGSGLGLAVRVEEAGAGVV
jgi:hypothetical protein